MVLDGFVIDNATFIAILALVFALAFGVMGVWQAGKLERLTKETKDLPRRISEYQGDEKTAVLWRHAKEVDSKLKIDKQYELEEIKSNIRAAGRLEPFYSPDERMAITKLFPELENQKESPFLFGKTKAGELNRNRIIARGIYRSI